MSDIAKKLRASRHSFATTLYATDIVRAADEIEQLRKRTEWQPIETAPKDRAVLLYCDHFAELGHFNTRLNRWVDNWQYRHLKEPTHWKDAVFPLPTKDTIRDASCLDAGCDIDGKEPHRPWCDHAESEQG